VKTQLTVQKPVKPRMDILRHLAKEFCYIFLKYAKPFQIDVNSTANLATRTALYIYN